MFVSRMGPRSRTVGPAETISQKRLIRLSTPLLQRPSAQGDGTLVSTIAHEMIHQWQFDVLKRRPNHGPDFCRKMTEMNHGGLGITIRHDLQEALRALIKHVWRCQRCGRSYERQRRTIRPGRHRCGACRGTLREVGAAPGQARPSPSGGMRNSSIMDRLMRLNRGARLTRTVQLELNFVVS
jgi:predicted SprT family Zn-dependent metalloprotease